MGFSVRLKRGKLDLNAQGNLYYPIVVPEAYTKSCISISAPFMLDSKRKYSTSKSSVLESLVITRNCKRLDSYSHER